MDFEVVTHCVHYAKLLSFQLSSLVLHPPSEGHRVKYTLCYTAGDAATEAVVRFFDGCNVPGITWNWQNMRREALNRRTIGRNAAALATKADWVWFTDADYCFGRDCFAMLAKVAAEQHGPLIFPRRVFATTIEDGDELVREAGDEPAIRDVPEGRWSTRLAYQFAVGGVQIARAEACRKQGYLAGVGLWHREAPVWKRCTEDRAFRKMLGTPGQAISLKPVYRIRHSAKGREDPEVRL